MYSRLKRGGSLGQREYAPPNGMIVSAGFAGFTSVANRETERAIRRGMNRNGPLYKLEIRGTA